MVNTNSFYTMVFSIILYSQIGFMNEFSKNTCYKTTKEILSNMATKFPGLISYILDIIKSEIQNVI